MARPSSRGRFDEDAKAYFNADGKRCAFRVTDVAKAYYPSTFDPDKILGYMRKRAEQRGEIMDPDEMFKAKWAQTGCEAADFGTRCHGFAEDELKHGIEWKPVGKNEEAVHEQWEEAIQQLEEEQWHYLAAEEIVVCGEVGGRFDVLFARKNRSTDTLKLRIIDYKFCKAVDQSNARECGAYPFDFRPICKYNLYALQANMYAHMIRSDPQRWLSMADASRNPNLHGCERVDVAYLTVIQMHPNRKSPRLIDFKLEPERTMKFIFASAAAAAAGDSVFPFNRRAPRRYSSLQRQHPLSAQR